MRTAVCVHLSRLNFLGQKRGGPSMRRFQFEADIYETLNCVPMAVRRKLDKIGLKVGLDQWQALSRAERLAVCYLPAESHDEIQRAARGTH
jgi:hypothetical protein